MLAAARLYLEDLAQLSEVPWEVMDRDYWADVKEERQAEFLVHEFFPWEAVMEIATMTPAVQQRVQGELRQVQYRPPVALRPAWYY